jgi:hypothetical protein
MKSNRNWLMSILSLLLFVILLSCSRVNVRLDINNEAEIMKYLQGEWNTTLHKPERELRLVINGNKMKLWEKYKEIGEWQSEPNEADFTLSSPTSGLDEYFKGRVILFDESNLKLAFRAINNMYIICDDDWAKSADPGFGCGGVYFSRVSSASINDNNAPSDNESTKRIQNTNTTPAAETNQNTNGVLEDFVEMDADGQEEGPLTQFSYASIFLDYFNKHKKEVDNSGEEIDKVEVKSLVIADLNGDKINDAIINYSYHHDLSNYSISELGIVINEGGILKVKKIACGLQEYPLALKVQEGKIEISRREWGKEDTPAGGGPSIKILEDFMYINGKLELQKQLSKSKL